MKRQYIDFIPYNDNTSPLFEDEATSSEHKSYVHSLEKSHSKLGMVEDIKPTDDSSYFDDEADVITPVRYHSYPVAPSLQSSNSENLANKPLILRKPRTIAQPVEHQKDLSGYHPPKIPFINTQVEKRPLSKNIYGSQNIFELEKTKPSSYQSPDTLKKYFKDPTPKLKPKPEAPKEESTEDMLRVVDEPEKKSHAGIIFAIIASIILGAAAGVVIYLFFP